MSTKKKNTQPSESAKLVLPQVDIAKERRACYRMRTSDWLNQQEHLLNAELNAQLAAVDAQVEQGFEVEHDLRALTKAELGALAKINQAMLELWQLAETANVTNDATRVKLQKRLKDNIAHITGMAKGEIRPMTSEETKQAEEEAAAIEAELAEMAAKLAAAKAKLGK
tara:strand:+ start:402 stop:905 length:504 start_codon:yes stop_codon:yes gene_type:complete